MKIFFTYTLIFSLISYKNDNMKLENVLCKHISVAEKLTGYTFEEGNFNFKNSKIKYFSIKLNPNDNSDKLNFFYGMPYRLLFIQTDENKMIKSIGVFFNKHIDRKFYEAFNKAYGEPTNILIIDERVVISESVLDNGFGQASKAELKLREGTFEEDPLYIIWEKESYQIKALLRQQNMSEITFSKK